MSPSAPVNCKGANIRSAKIEQADPKSSAAFKMGPHLLRMVAAIGSIGRGEMAYEGNPFHLGLGGKD